MADAPLLELRGITKRFPGVLANDDVSFDLREGEVHALLGENGAGKSTLMNILYGLYTPDAGQIVLRDKPVELGSTKASIEQGIGMVHQHFMLIPVMTVAENIVLATEPRRAGVLLDYDAARRRVRELSERYGLAVDPDARIDRITVGQQQRVEILKALYRGADILILDEPTAVLTPQEAKELFEILRALKAQGKSIIFISHKLNEVIDIADRITVVRRGVVVDTIPVAGATEEGLARMMVGREVLLRVDKEPAAPAEPLLQVEHLTVIDDRGLETVHDVGFVVHGGEIVGLAGVDANGQSELIDADLRAPPCEVGARAGRRAGDHERDGQARARQRPRAHPRGPAPARARAAVLADREPRPARLPAQPQLAPRLPRPARDDRPRPPAVEGVRRARRHPRRPRPAHSRAATSRRSCSPVRSTAIPAC